MKVLILSFVLWTCLFSGIKASTKGPEIVIGSINGGFPAFIQENPLIHSNFEADAVDLLGTNRVPFVKEYNQEISRLLPLMYPKAILGFRASLAAFAKEYGDLEHKEKENALEGLQKEKNAVNQALISYAKDQSDTNRAQLKALYYMYYGAWQTTVLASLLDIVNDVNQLAPKSKSKATFKVYPIAWHPRLLAFLKLNKAETR